MIVVFEGCDGIGKTTQLEIVAKRLDELSIKYKIYKFPNSNTDLGKYIRSLLGNEDESTATLQLLFAFERQQMLEEMKSYHERGDIVLVDRFIYSGLVYSKCCKLDMQLFSLVNNLNCTIDLIIHLTTKNIEILKSRIKPNVERFDDEHFQLKVIEEYHNVLDGLMNVFEIEADAPCVEITNLICGKIVEMKKK